MEYFKTDFKSLVLAAEDVEKYVELECEKARAIGAKCFKVLHGYGSHQRGGSICGEIRKVLPRMKRQKKICDYVYGCDFCLANSKAARLVFECPPLANDEDFNAQNPGITIIVP